MNSKRQAAWAAKLGLAALLLAAPGVAGAAAASAAPPAAAAEFQLVALGDSITAGFEPNVDYAKQQPYGYADRLYEQSLLHGRASLANYGLVGLKSEGLKAFAQAVAAGQPIAGEAIQSGLPDYRADEFGQKASEIRAELAGADAVAVTIGGNDVSSLLNDAASMTDEALEAKVAELLGQYSLNVSASIDALLSVNPSLRLYIADQYQPVPMLAGKDLYAKLNKATAAFTANLDALAAGYKAKGANVTAVHVADDFAGREGMLTHMVSARDFHPTQAGYAVIAGEFGRAVWGSYTGLPLRQPARR